MKQQQQMPTSQAQSNFDAYVALHRDQLEQSDAGRVALLHDGELIDVCEDIYEAYEAGCKQFGPGKFSYQRIGAKPINLGILTALMSSGE